MQENTHKQLILFLALTDAKNEQTNRKKHQWCYKIWNTISGKVVSVKKKTTTTQTEEWSKQNKRVRALPI